MLDRRLAGVLLHPTSLPGPYGIGDLGPEAYKFLDWLQAAGLVYWQVLPLGPTSYGDSPYQCFSAFAGNPLLVSPERLVECGSLTHEEIASPGFPLDRVDYGWIIPWKHELLRLAHQRFQQGKCSGLRSRYDAFLNRSDVQVWLDDYALFMALKDANEGRAWNTWDADLRCRKPAVLKAARKEHAERFEYHRFIQFLFFDQWDALHDECKRRGIGVIGDAPIYVSYDSADTWAHQDLFSIGKDGSPTHVAGVPPDYFSKTGQLWGNPLYRWDKMEKTGYQWWIDRMKSVLSLVDVVRLDHFRGFMGYYSVPFGAETAENGAWCKGPGEKVFQAIKDALHSLPIIAEDLGEITVDVTKVRQKFDLPGMKIMQFAWSPESHLGPPVPDPGNQFQLHRHEPNMVVYTGTHDNDTTLGWWRGSSNDGERTMMQLYMATDGKAANWDLIRAAMMSIANTAIVPMQDFMDLGTEARMNFPGRAENNWNWRLAPGQLTEDLAKRIRAYTLLYERCGNPPKEVSQAKPKMPEY